MIVKRMREYNDNSLSVNRSFIPSHFPVLPEPQAQDAQMPYSVSS